MPFSSVLNRVQRELLPVGGFSLLINLLMLVSSIYMLQVFDRVLASGSLDTLLSLTAYCDRSSRRLWRAGACAPTDPEPHRRLARA